MMVVRLQVSVSAEARDAAIRRAILGNGEGEVRLTFGQRRALERIRALLSAPAVPSPGSSS
jgi:hypothetical protein